MPRYETRSSQFGLISGIHQPHSDMLLVAEPLSVFAPEGRKGQLYIITEADQDIARGRDACQLVIKTIRKQFYEDSSYSVTSSLRKAISTANTTLYQHNFDVLAPKRAVVGVTCAVIKDNDLYLAQVAPTQSYMLTEGKLRALPITPSWNSAHVSTTPFFKPGALGASLSIEPDFYRAVLRPGDALLLCSSNLSRLLSHDEVLRLLRSADPADMIERLLTLCKQNSLPEAHGVVAAIHSPLSPAAQAAPLSRAGVSERGRFALHTVGDWATRFTREAARIVKGPQARKRQQQSEHRHAQERRAQEQLSTPPDEPRMSPKPPPAPRPLDMGESLDQQINQARQERSLARGMTSRPASEEQPPSMFLGEGGYLPPAPVERRIDLSDTPGMATLGRTSRQRSEHTPAADQTLGERAASAIAQAAGAITSAGRRRRLRRPPPSSMPQARRQQGLSYRRQRPPFPFLLLALLVSLVGLLILYGVNVSRENALRQADDSLVRAEQVVASVREAPDNAAAQARLDEAAAALAEVRASRVVTATQENRRRYEGLQSEYQRALAAIQKLNYFSDLTEIATHPLAGGRFDSVVIPPPPQGITNTEAFGSLYILDSNAGLLYRLPKTGGALEPFLRPDDSFGGLRVGVIKSQAWRVDDIVTVAQSVENGPFAFYFRTSGGWSFSNLAGSEEWGRVGKHFRAVNYEGNLYIWGATPGQVLKYFSGRYGEFPTPWIQNDAGHKPDSAIDLAVDGKVYLLQPDGHIHIFAAGAFEREIAPPTLTPPLVTPAGFFLTGPPESGMIFLVDTNNERIIQLDKQTGALIQQIRANPDGPLHLDQLTSIYVDDSASRPMLYLVNGDQILRGSLPDPPRPFHEPGTPSPTDATAPSSPTAIP